MPCVSRSSKEKLQKMIYNLIWGFVLAAVLCVMVLGTHEAGHLSTLNKYGRNARVYYNKNKKHFSAGKPSDYKGLTRKQLKEVYVNGVLIGFIPIILFMAFLDSFAPLLAIPAYLLGCRYDIREIKRLYKK